jgi:hypothetical protein
MRKAFIAIIIIAIIVPGLYKLFTGYFFGNDPYEYALSAQSMFLGIHTIYAYPYPVMGIVYFPTIFFNTVFMIWYATILSMLLFLLAFFAFYYMLRSLSINDYSSMLGALIFAFSPPLLSEIGWGGQAQFLSFIFSFFAIYFYMTNSKYLCYILIFLAIITEPYTSLFGLATLFFLILYSKRYRILIYYFAGAVAGALVLILNKSSAGIVIQPLILHLNFNIFSAYYNLYFVLMLAVIIYMIIEMNRNKLFIKTDTGKKYVPLLIFFALPLLIYLFVTPYTVPARIAYFIIIPIALAISFFSYVQKNARAIKKYTVVAIAIIVVLVSYNGYFGALQFYQNPIYMEDAGSFINANSLKNDSFLNVNIQAGWALESFSEREMYFAAGNMTNMIYKDQMKNILDGEIMSSSIQYINSSSTYLLLSTLPSPMAIYTFNNYEYFDILTLNVNESGISNESIGSSEPVTLQAHSSAGNMSIIFNEGNAIYVNLSVSKNAMLFFNLENCTYLPLNSSALELISANSIKIIMSFKDIAYSINTTTLKLSFAGNAQLKISTGELFQAHSSDSMFKDLNVKFAVLYDNVQASRFYNDPFFKLAYRISNILIFETV